MQGGQGPGRGIYVARRIVAALVILLLIALFVPRACQTLLGSGEEPGSVSSDMSVSNGDPAGSPDESTREQEPEQDSGASGDESENRAEEAPGIVVDAVITPPAVVPQVPFEEVSFGGDAIASPLAPVPVVEEPQPVTETIAAEPVAFREPVPTPESIPVAVPAPPVQAPVPLPQPVPLQQPILYEEPGFYETPVLYEEPTYFYEAPVLYEEPVYMEATPVETLAVSDPAPSEEYEEFAGSGSMEVPQALISDAS